MPLYRFEFPEGSKLPSGKEGFFICRGPDVTHLQVIHGLDDIDVTEHLICCGHNDRNALKPLGGDAFTLLVLAKVAQAG